jgi:hypothetical protein
MERPSASRPPHGRSDCTQTPQAPRPAKPRPAPFPTLQPRSGTAPFPPRPARFLAGQAARANHRTAAECRSAASPRITLQWINHRRARNSARLAASRATYLQPSSVFSVNRSAGRSRTTAHRPPAAGHPFVRRAPIRQAWATDRQVPGNGSSSSPDCRPPPGRAAQRPIHVQVVAERLAHVPSRRGDKHDSGRARLGRSVRRLACPAASRAHNNSCQPPAAV